ncbi:MAG: hypothetical protein WC292_00220 [Clostridia bacterium]
MDKERLKKIREGFAELVEKNNNADKYDWNALYIYNEDDEIVKAAQEDLLNSTDCIYITPEDITALFNGKILGFKNILIKLKKEEN